jgi:outer membrane protein assembly factor BamB
MRRSLLTLTLASLVALVSLAGCSKESPAPKPEGSSPVKAPAAKTPAPATKPATTAWSGEKTFGWRGDGTGRFHGAQPPDAWSGDEKKNILWTLKVGKSYSSPVIAGDKLFLTSEQEKLICVDAVTHKIVWEKNNAFEDLPAEMNAKEKRYPASSGFAAATPVTDGKLVWASFGTGIVGCYDLDGNRKWVVYIDHPQTTEYGRTACPLLVDGKLIVTIGWLMALDPATGKTLWEAKDATERYGTPAVARIAKAAVLITPAGDVVKASDGTIVERELSMLAYASPVVEGSVV